MGYLLMSRVRNPQQRAKLTIVRGDGHTYDGPARTPFAVVAVMRVVVRRRPVECATALNHIG